jgi:hypothetical protein
VLRGKSGRLAREVGAGTGHDSWWHLVRRCG